MKNRAVFLIVPSLLLMMISFIYPITYIVVNSFKKSTFDGSFAGIYNYIQVLNNEYFRMAMQNTLKFTLVSVFLTMLFAVLTALILSGISLRISFVKAFFIIPYLLPSSLITSVWNYMCPEAPRFLSLVCLFVAKNIGIVILLLLSSLGEVSIELIDAAKIDGAKKMKLVTKVYLPSISPTILFTFLLTLAASASIYRESLLLYGNYPGDDIYMIQNYLNNHFIKMNYQNISTASVIYTVLLFFVALFALYAERRYSND